MSHLLHPPMQIHPKAFPRLGPELEKAVFRIVQEALTNVFRHSKAGKTSVSLAKKDGHISGTIRDDGVGISAATAEFRAGSIGVGIAGMRQRVKELSGELRLSNAFPWTIVQFTIPVRSVISEEPVLFMNNRLTGS